MTDSVISGRRLYYGEAQRPNYLIWMLTINGASPTATIIASENSIQFRGSWTCRWGRRG